MASAHEFVNRTSVKLSEEDQKLFDNAPVKEIKSFENLDDPKYNWVMVGTGKYGRLMWCTNLKIKRGQTMGEFYGTSTVD